MDSLFASPSEPVAGPPTGQSPPEDALRQILSKLDPDAANPPEASAPPPAESRPPEEELLQAFEKLNPGTKKTPAPDPPEAPPPAPQVPEGELLQALQKLDSSPSDPPAASEPPKSPPPRASEPKSSQVFRKPGAPKPTDRTVPPQPPHSTDRHVQDSETTRPRSPSSDSSAQETAFEPEPTLSRESARDESIHHARHRLRPPPPTGSGRRNLLYMGVITVVCVLVAGALALIQYYASQIDITELKANAEKAAAKQATDQILQELQKGR